MIKTEADKIITRLKNACTFNRFDEPGVLAEYTKYLLKNDFRTMNKAIDDALEEESRNVPSISLLAKCYKKYAGNKPSVTAPVNEEYCDVCDDKGFIMITEMRKFNEEDEKTPFQFIAYCPFCEVGRSYAYDGRKNSKFPTDYCIYPITHYFDGSMIATMKKHNREHQKQRQSGKRMTPEEIKALLKNAKNIGQNIPELMSWERGDAWEPPEEDDDEQCPF